jgi:hypothetical protein
MSENLLYEERLSSGRTTALFLTLALISLALWKALPGAGGPGWLIGLFGFLFGMFAFYTLNYRTLVIRITRQALTLTFGLFRWVVPVDNITSCSRDELAPLERNGGAGVHFMMVRGRYRANLNLLEYSRLVIAFKEKVGPVRDLSFSTRRPDEVMRSLDEIAREENASSSDLAAS